MQQLSDFMTLIAHEIRARIDSLDCIDLKNFWTSKEAITETKIQPTEWEKFFASSSSDKRLVPEFKKTSTN
jgi:hypothetical protein